MKRKYWIGISTFLILTIIGIFAYVQYVNINKGNPDLPTNFDECFNLGYPIMESYPRQCNADGIIFIEDLSGKFTEVDARKIAQTSCIKGGETLGRGIYNEITKTWWFDANLNIRQDGCNPACVVFENTKTTEINWRCTGLTEEEYTPAETLIRKAFVIKYPKFADTLKIRVVHANADFMRGTVTFVEGAAGGIFLARRVDESWEISHEGNGQIPCSLSDLGYPPIMLTDCSE